MRVVHVCEVIYNEKLNNETYAVSVKCGEAASVARAGQFIHVKCTDALLLRRPLSICAVRGDTIKIVFEVKGEGTRQFSGVKPGEMLDIMGPLGNGFSDAIGRASCNGDTMSDGKLLVVGGGIGVAPLLFAAESSRCSVTAVLGFRDEGRIILRSEFEAACDNMFITTDDGSYGIHGPVTKPLAELLEAGDYDVVFSCGPRVMLQAVANLCRQHSTPCLASMEERMGCGIGACLVCACETVSDGQARMSRVCKDGPVFDSEEVVWEA